MTATELGRRMDASELAEWRALEELRAEDGAKQDLGALVERELTRAAKEA